RNSCSLASTRLLCSTLTIVRVPQVMSRRNELTRQAARLFAQKGYHGTSIGDLAEAMGVQKGSLYAHIASKQDLLYETMAEGARAFHAGLDAIDDRLPATEKIRLALRSHLRVLAEPLARAPRPLRRPPRQRDARRCNTGLTDGSVNPMLRIP